MKRDELAGTVAPRELPLDPVAGRLPLVTPALIAANVILFACQLAAGEASDYGITGWGLTPQRLLDFPASGFQPILTLFTSMFLHAGFTHLFGNMIFLWVFGRGVEHAMGPARFAGFYIIAGLVSAMVQVLTGPDPGIPHLGASGAVSGVLGAFLLLYPFRPMGLLALTAIHPGLLGFYLLSRVLRLERGIIQIPAVLYLLLWFGVQVLGSTAVETRGCGRIDFLAHVAGFAAGVLLVVPFTGRNYSRAVRMPEEE